MKFLLTIIVAALTALIVSVWVGPNIAERTAAGQSSEPNSVYERVMKTDTIRCGYSLRPPLFYKDVNTNHLTGIAYDLTEEIGKRLSLKIEWVEEVGFGTIIQSILSDRIDMACGAYWANAQRSKRVDFTEPFFYEVLYVYQRVNDARQFTDYNQLNAPEYTFSAIDGSTPFSLHARHFAKAQLKSLPELSPTSETFEDLAAGKVDFVVNPDLMATDFIRARPNTIKKTIDRPLSLYPVVMMLPPNESQLKVMIDVALEEIVYDGTLDAMVRQHGLQNSLLFNVFPQEAQNFQ